MLTLDRSGWRDLSAGVFDVISKRGSNVEWGRLVPSAVSALGLKNLRAESEFPYFHGGSGLAEFWKQSWSRVRDGVAAAGADVSHWDRELSELDDPTRVFVSAMTVAVIAEK